MKTLILLIDFYGHPALTTDPYSDSVRYSYLTEIISSGFIDKKNCVFFSTTIHDNDKRLEELRHMAISKGFAFVTPLDNITSIAWDEHDNNYTIDYLKSKLKDVMKIDNTDTQIIVTGTNTSGCVFKNKDIGAFHWSKADYKTKIYLPMCAEYENKGINDFERNMLGVASLYKQMQKEKCFNIKICRDFNDLNLPV